MEKKKYLQTISMRPSPSTEEKFGASADISHRYSPPDLRLNFFSKTLTSFDACSCEWIYERNIKRIPT